jgi:hypothetical protein
MNSTIQIICYLAAWNLLLLGTGCWKNSNSAPSSSGSLSLSSSASPNPAPPPEAQVERFFQFPPGVTPNPDQVRNVQMIKSKYIPQLFSLHAAQRYANGHPQQIEAQKKFYYEREMQIIAEIQKAMDSLLTPEQRQQINEGAAKPTK